MDFYSTVTHRSAPASESLVGGVFAPGGQLQLGIPVAPSTASVDIGSADVCLYYGDSSRELGGATFSGFGSWTIIQEVLYLLVGAWSRRLGRLPAERAAIRFRVGYPRTVRSKKIN